MTLTQGLVYVVVGWGFLNVFLFLAQPQMIFFPTKKLAGTPRTWGLDYEDVHITTTDDVILHGWLVPRAGARRTFLFFHGNAGNISHRGESITIFHDLGVNVLIIDYRGYGRSGGSPSEAGLYRDARAAWRWLTDDRGIRAGDVVVFGRSLGGVVAAKLAAEVRPAALILESSLSSARDAANLFFPLLSRFVVLRFDLDAADAVRRVACPVLVLHSREDEVIPYRLGRKLYNTASEPKEFVDLTGGHNEGFLVSQPAYEQALARFLATLPADVAPRNTP